MKRFIYLLVILLSGTASYAQRDTITAEKAGSFVGKNVLLCDRIKDGHMDNISKDEPTIVYVGDTYETSTLLLVFNKNDLKSFSFNPETKMENHTFCVHGKVTMYKGKPAIYVKSEAQLNVEE